MTLICLSNDDITMYFESINQLGKWFNTSPSNIRKYVRESKPYKGFNISKVNINTPNKDNSKEIIDMLNSIYWNNVCIRISMLILILGYLYNYL